MPFWTYMLHCRGGYFYVGHTDDLDRRISEHQSGLIPGFTSDHQPVELVWSDEFQTREDAKASERKLKGWSRAKKLALIRDDWDRISTLAKKKDSASTSSARTGQGEKPTIQFSGYPELVERLHFSLQPHPEARPWADFTVSAKVRIADGLLWLTFEATPATKILIPQPAERRRLDGLWQATCFELFVKKAVGYAEFNFSPSGNWAAYRFAGYRDGMKQLAMRNSPVIDVRTDMDRLIVTIALDRAVLPQDAHFALSAVIEETDGTKSYWALAHPRGAPDFHHPSCFTATLPPPSKA